MIKSTMGSIFRMTYFNKVKLIACTNYRVTSLPADSQVQILSASHFIFSSMNCYLLVVKLKSSTRQGIHGLCLVKA